MSKIHKAIFFSVLNQYSLQLVGIVSVAIIARLLTPETIGIFSVATTIAFVAIEIRAFGVGEYLIREKHVDPEKIKSVLGVMIIMSWGLALILIIAAPWIADFYNEPALRNVLWIITIPFFVAPYSSIPFALLTRDMQFSAILRINLIGSLVRNGGSIGLILLGYGYYGLAYGALAGVLAEFLAITYFRPASMSWVPSFRGLNQILRVGAQISVSRFLYTTSQNSTDLVLGRLASMNDVGLYSRGLGLILFLNSLLIKAVGPVSLPHLAQVRREGGDMRAAYLDAITLVGAFTLPLFAVVNVSAFSMINALFGDQWLTSVHVASTLSLWAMLQSVHCFSTPALLAIGKERLVLLKEVVSFVVKVALIILAVPYGLEMVAWSVVVSGLIDFLFVTWQMKMAYGISVRALFIAFIPNFFVTVACWAILKLMHTYIAFESLNSWIALIVIAGVMIPVWLLTIRISNNKAWPFVNKVIQKAADLGLSRWRTS